VTTPEWGGAAPHPPPRTPTPVLGSGVVTHGSALRSPQLRAVPAEERQRPQPPLSRGGFPPPPPQPRTPAAKGCGRGAWLAGVGDFKGSNFVFRSHTKLQRPLPEVTECA